VWSKVPQKFPELKYALSEGGIGWIPYFRERIDYTYDRHRFWTGQDMGDRRPSQVFDDQVVQRVLGVAEDAAGVDESEGHALPLGVMRHDVAGGPGHRVDDGATGARDAIEERRLAHVGAADEHHGGQRAGV